MERTRNPFTSSATGGRVLSALQLPLFLLRPPAGYGVLATTGRKTGKTRRRCIRAIRAEDKVHIVAIKGARTGWARNALANPEVRLRIRGGTFEGVARRPEGAEVDAARRVYCESVNPFEYLEFMMWRAGRPTREEIKQLHQSWFDQGTPLVIDLR